MRGCLLGDRIDRGVTGTRDAIGHAAACAIGLDEHGDLAIARGLLYGAGLEYLAVSVKDGASFTTTLLRDDFYSQALALAVGGAGLEVAAAGFPYDGSGSNTLKLRWAHR